MTAVRLMPKPAPRVSLMKLCGCTLHKAKKPAVTNIGKYVEGHAPKVARRIENVLNEHAVRVAKKAAKLWVNKMLKAENDIVASILAELNLNDVSVAMIDSLTPDMIKAFQSAGILGVAQVGITATADMTNHMDEAALSYAEDHGAELAKGLTATTTEALRGTLSDAVKGGWSTADLSKAIQASFAFDAARANTIARTELATAHVQGNVQGWRETGQVEGKEWILGDLHDIEDECDENATAGVVPMDDDFPSGIAFPPAHPNCICDVLPVLSERGA